jgi:hypothetical protein
MSTDRNQIPTSCGEDEAALESLLSRHFSKALDGQLGRAAERFEAEMARGPVASVQPSARWRRPDRAFWAWAGSVTAVAASIALVFAVVRFGPPSPHDSRGSLSHTAPSTAPAGPTLVASTAPAPSEEPIERAMWWRTIDQGTVYIDDTPMRQLLRQQVEELKYRGPDGTESVQVNVPREEVMLVVYNKY